MERLVSDRANLRYCRAALALPTTLPRRALPNSSIGIPKLLYKLRQAIRLWAALMMITRRSSA